MNDKKIRVAILFGGKSAEHEVSIQSARNVYQALDRDKYDVVLVGIDKKGKWHISPQEVLLESSITHPKSLRGKSEVVLVSEDGEHSLVAAHNQQSLGTIDVVFPVLHGTYGEDGTVQGLLKLADVPFVGSDVLGSAIGMDKDVSKRLLKAAGLPVTEFLVFRKGDEIDFSTVEKKLGLPVFVKPANLGSSVGITKVKSENDFAKAVADAFLYDTKILIEKGIIGREVECAVLGNEHPKASIVGEIILTHEFYDYDAKYVDEHGARLQIPANISEEKQKEIQELAVKAFQALCLEGMARIDFFLSKSEEVYISEANTIPGFTNSSMYPKMWEASGVSNSELVDTLIQLAIEKYQVSEKLKTSK